VATVTGETIRYSKDTADLYEQAEGYVARTEGGLALAPVYKKGWKTYNFEVADYHTYVAGGVRVHNKSYDYKVHYGDTLSQIAQRNNTTVAAIMADRRNSDIVDPNKIYAGKTIHLTPGGALAKQVMSSDGSDKSPSNVTYVSKATGEVLHPVQTTRYDPDSGAFKPVTVYKPAPATTAPTGTTSSPPTSTPAPRPEPRLEREKDSSGSSSGTTYVSASTGQKLTPQQTKRYNPDTNTFKTVTVYRPEKEKSEKSSSKGKPILLDLNGDGVDITPLSSSNFFFDMDGDGKLNRTAWAAAGGGVLVRD